MKRTQTRDRRRTNDILVIGSKRPTRGAKNEPKLLGFSIAGFAGRLVPNSGDESATNHSCRGPSRGCVHRWTSARKRPKNSHFFSLFGPPGVIPTCRDSIRKSFHAKQIRSDMWPSRASKTPCGTWDPKFSYRFPLIVHYLKPWSVDRGRRHMACSGGGWTASAGPTMIR